MYRRTIDKYRNQTENVLERYRTNKNIHNHRKAMEYI